MKTLWFLALLAFIPVAGFGLRPFYLFRGLSEAERRRDWPGDNQLAHACPSGSRGITILAPASVVWSWITQIGQDRAGFYSYRWLENLFGAAMPDVRRHVAEWSARTPGQKLRMAPVSRFGPIAEMDIVAVDPPRSLVAVNAEGTWSFIVEPIDRDSCRFIARGTWIPARNPLARAARALFFDPIHYIMEWKMLRTIKQLSEREAGQVKEIAAGSRSTFESR